MRSLRDLLLSAALLGAVVAHAAPAPVAALEALPSLALAQSDDDDDEDAPATTPAEGDQKPEGQPVSTTPEVTASNTPTAVQSDAAVADPDAQKLVSGAPLYNPNVAVHIVEKKAHSDAKKFEIVLYPATMQVNGKFTQHFGTMGSVVYHLQENFGLQITGGYNWYNVESSFNGELVEKYSVEAQAATSLLWTWGVLGGVEVTPFYGKFAFFDGTLAHFSFVLNGGVGAGGTRHQLRPEAARSDGTTTPATYGDTGARFMGSIGAGFRLQLGEHFAFRLEVRDVVYSARVQSVNGCDSADLKAMDDKIKGGQDPASAMVGGSCNLGDFTGTVEGTDLKKANDVPLALALVKTPSSDVLNNVGLYLGVSFNF